MRNINWKLVFSQLEISRLGGRRVAGCPVGRGCE
jgi:hypothetical protein